MKKLTVIMLSLFLLLVLIPQAVTNPDGSSYDPMSDVNRDKTIDVYDLNRLGKAYGSTQTIPTQPGKTTIYVYQLETDPPQIENARVVIIDPEYYYQAVQVGYTNSSGIAAFSLNPDSNYTAIAWSQTTYSYANFTTNELGEAAVSIRLGYPRLPSGWVVITLINKTSDELLSLSLFGAIIGELVFNSTSWEFDFDGIASIVFDDFRGVFVAGPWHAFQPMTAGTSYSVVFYISEWGDAISAYTPDENGNANTVTYV